MCSIITLATDALHLHRELRVLGELTNAGSVDTNLRAHGYLKREKSPVVFYDSAGQLRLEMKYFSLCPPWAKVWPFSFSTYNARLSRPKAPSSRVSDEPLFFPESRPVELESIYDVPSFKHAFCNGQACLVPISGAIESCYFGEQAGHIVRFFSSGDRLIFALGLWHDWIDPATGEVIPTFTLLTDDPDEFVFRNGHDRGLVLLPEACWTQWLTARMRPQERMDFIRSHRTTAQWDVAVERPLKTGWQKRAPSQRELETIQVFHAG